MPRWIALCLALSLASLGSQVGQDVLCAYCGAYCLLTYENAISLATTNGFVTEFSLDVFAGILCVKERGEHFIEEK